jgi:hypothetical protein
MFGHGMMPTIEDRRVRTRFGVETESHALCGRRRRCHDVVEIPMGCLCRRMRRSSELVPMPGQGLPLPPGEVLPRATVDRDQGDCRAIVATWTSTGRSRSSTRAGVPSGDDHGNPSASRVPRRRGVAVAARRDRCPDHWFGKTLRADHVLPCRAQGAKGASSRRRSLRGQYQAGTARWQGGQCRPQDEP